MPLSFSPIHFGMSITGRTEKPGYEPHGLTEGIPQKGSASVEFNVVLVDGQAVVGTATGQDARAWEAGSPGVRDKIKRLAWRSYQNNGTRKQYRP